MSLKIAKLDDPGLLLEINNAAVPDINAIDASKAQWMVEHSVMPGLALLEEKVAGVVIVLSDQAGFDSDYYRWFTARYENFLYIDRVIVAGWARGRGVAKALYQEIGQVAQAREVAVVADVYSEPPNIPSLNLHRAMGFAEIGTEYMPAVQKTVTKFMRFEEYVKRKT
jgi:predicted GNAT superfamily acetyltransferase